MAELVILEQFEYQKRQNLQVEDYVQKFKTFGWDITSLDFSWCDLGSKSPKEIITIFNAIPKHVRSIKLDCNRLYLLGPDLVTVLNSLPEQLESLSLTENGFDIDNALVHLTTALPNLSRNIRKLNLTNIIKAHSGCIDGLIKLFAAIPSNVQYLNFNLINPSETVPVLTSKDYLLLFSALSQSQISTLGLPNNLLEYMDYNGLLQLFSKVPKTIKTLNLRGNAFFNQPNATLLDLLELLFSLPDTVETIVLDNYFVTKFEKAQQRFLELLNIKFKHVYWGQEATAKNVLSVINECIDERIGLIPELFGIVLDFMVDPLEHPNIVEKEGRLGISWEKELKLAKQKRTTPGTRLEEWIKVNQTKEEYSVLINKIKHFLDQAKKLEVQQTQKIHLAGYYFLQCMQDGDFTFKLVHQKMKKLADSWQHPPLKEMATLLISLANLIYLNKALLAVKPVSKGFDAEALLFPMDSIADIASDDIAESLKMLPKNICNLILPFKGNIGRDGFAKIIGAIPTSITGLALYLEDPLPSDEKIQTFVKAIPAHIESFIFDPRLDAIHWETVCNSLPDNINKVGFDLASLRSDTKPNGKFCAAVSKLPSHVKKVKFWSNPELYHRDLFAKLFLGLNALPSSVDEITFEIITTGIDDVKKFLLKSYCEKRFKKGSIFADINPTLNLMSLPAQIGLYSYPERTRTELAVKIRQFCSEAQILINQGEESSKIYFAVAMTLEFVQGNIDQDSFVEITESWFKDTRHRFMGQLMIGIAALAGLILTPALILAEATVGVYIAGAVTLGTGLSAVSFFANERKNNSLYRLANDIRNETLRKHDSVAFFEETGEIIANAPLVALSLIP